MRAAANKSKANRLAQALIVAAVLWVAQSGEAAAQVPIKEFSLEPTTTQAGGHPSFVLKVRVGNRDTEGPVPCECNSIRDITVSTPPGVLASPSAIPQCTAVQLGISRCPIDSQIGVSMIRFSDGSGPTFWQPLYNMQPAPSQLALLASPLPVISNRSTNTVISTRTEGDYGLEFKTTGIPVVLKTRDIVQVTWGVPADPAHTPLRFPLTGTKSVMCESGDREPLPELIADEYPLLDCPVPGTLPPSPAFKGVPANAQTVAFQSNPTTCAGPLTASVDTIGYDLSVDHANAPFPTPTGCDQLGFNPSLSAKPTTDNADSATGIDVELTVPQPLSPFSPSASQIRTSRITFPPGMSINANAADGKTSCSDEQANFGTRDEAECPEFSKIGTLEIESASLPGLLPGAIYLGEPLPGERYRVFLTADGFSVHVKIAGVARPDGDTGQLTVAFEDLPQTPFQRFNLHVFGAERGLLATPTQCGTYPVKSEFVPWATGLPIQESTQFFTIESGPEGSPCPAATRPFAPSLSAGVSDNTGGARTNFVLELNRRDGDQNLTAASVSNPPGFSAILAGIPYCSDATLASLAQSSYLGGLELHSPACAASQVGTAVAAVGAGSRPASLPARVYLAGPYKGAPISLAVVTPATSGPYDFGNVVVRIAVRVDPLTAQVTAVADPFPRIIEGVPLRLRRVLVVLDRPNFVLNPTNCDPLSITARIDGDQGARATLQTPFQVANCGALDFNPKLSLKLTGGLNRRGHPAIRATFTAGSGEANTRRVTVALPKGELLDNDHIGTVCTRVQFAADACPPSSKLGTAQVSTPILDAPLKGNVYLRSSSNNLPDLAVDLEGQVDFELIGRVDTAKNGALRTHFETAPDVPVSQFVLNLAGGAKGLLQNSESLCGKPKKATTTIVAHNGAVIKTKTKLQTSCGKKARHKRHGKRKAG